jgi:hypothetical protein
VPGLVYLLCAATSFTSGSLLLRASLGRHTGLLFWSSLCFFGMALNNLVMYFDSIVFPDVPFSPAANLISVISLALLVLALVWYSA